MLTTPVDPSIQPVRIGQFPAQLPLGFGGSWFVPYSAPGEEDARLLGAIEAAYDAGIRHFDTAGGYGDGHSEEIYGRFLEGRRGEIFLASKSNPTETTAAAMMAEVDASLRRLKTDYIDLYYIHWPRSGADMRPRMEALEDARRQGKIRATGVSNFSVDADARGAGGRPHRRPPARLQPALALRRGRPHPLLPPSTTSPSSPTARSPTAS